MLAVKITVCQDEKTDPAKTRIINERRRIKGC